MTENQQNETTPESSLAAELARLENIEPGIYADISNDAYHAGPGISKTGLDLLHRSPFHYHAIKAGLFPKPETKSQYIGRAFHCLVLEPDVFAKTYCLPLRKQDVEIDGLKVLESREEIVALIQHQNAENLAHYPNLIRDKDEILALLVAQNEKNEAPYKDAIRDTSALVEMIEILNKGREPKISASGKKDDVIARIVEAENALIATVGDVDPDQTAARVLELKGLKGDGLKIVVDALNENREGLLSTSGSRAELAARLRENGVNPVLWDEVTKEFQDKNGFTLTCGVNASRGAAVEWLRNHGHDLIYIDEAAEQWLEQKGFPITCPESANRADAVAWLAANGKNVKLWQDCLAEWTEANTGRICIQPEEWERLHNMDRALRNHQTASKLLFSKRGGKAEQSIYWRDPETGVLLRVRPDWMRNDNLPVDLKTADDASEEGFRRHICNYRYDVSECMYLDGVEAVTGQRPPAMPFVVVENKPPFAVAVYTIGPKGRATGAGQLRADIRRYAECLEADHWPAYPDTVTPIDVTDWHVKNNAHLIEE